MNKTNLKTSIYQTLKQEGIQVTKDEVQIFYQALEKALINNLIQEQQVVLSREIGKLVIGFRKPTKKKQVYNHLLQKKIVIQAKPARAQVRFKPSLNLKTQLKKIKK